MPKIITKFSGKQEPFKKEKFERSLRNAGADEATILLLTEEVIKNNSLSTTKDIYQFALDRLKKLYRPAATRYNLKNALLRLGPTGFPFEKLIAKLFEEYGYKTTTDAEILGKCINHEIDVVGTKEYEFLIAEAKYHNTPGQKVDIQDALYTKARFDDIKAYYKEAFPKKSVISMLVTNTQFSAMTIEYAECAGLTLLGWGYPAKQGLEIQLEEHNLIPITSLTSISSKVMQQLIESGCILCRDITKHEKMLKRILPSDKKLDDVLEEATKVCQ